MKGLKLILVGLAVLASAAAAAHKGEHNETGCHKHEKGEYHCHPSK